MVGGSDQGGMGNASSGRAGAAVIFCINPNERSTTMTGHEDEALLARMTDAVTQAGLHLLARFRTSPAPATLPDLLAGIDANDAAVEADLRDALLAARPGSRWAADEEEEGALPAGNGGSPIRRRATSTTCMAVPAGASPRRWSATANRF